MENTIENGGHAYVGGDKDARREASFPNRLEGETRGGQERRLDRDGKSDWKGSESGKKRRAKENELADTV